MRRWDEPTVPTPYERMADLVAVSRMVDDPTEYVPIVWDTDEEKTQPAICTNSGKNPRFCDCGRCRVVPADDETPRTL
ncbi:MAG TPA: hypothetical protein VFB66_03820 [Tepidisphaeraceae bacterium]|nr:hypothetical protein [Tepidisphaeraceae bacterium]